VEKKKGRSQDGVAADLLDLHCRRCHHPVRSGLDLPRQVDVVEVDRGGVHAVSTQTSSPEPVSAGIETTQP
jgi:hypothetical protein